jgi:hypothetical protein
MSDWTRAEVEAVVDDYLSMLALELAGAPYSKAAHLRRLQPRLVDRSKGSVEFKRANVSAALIEAGFQYIDGYKPRGNYQGRIDEVLAERLPAFRALHDLAAADADRPMVVPEVEDILAVLTGKPAPIARRPRVEEPRTPRMTTNYLEREARNRSLGEAGELFTLNYERARLISLGHERFADRIEHTSRTRGDHAGYDILSFEASGQERLIEVKTTKYGASTPFFVSRNEVSTSERHAETYHVYRLYSFRASPRLYMLPGAIRQSCSLIAESFLARPV